MTLGMADVGCGHVRQGRLPCATPGCARGWLGEMLIAPRPFKLPPLTHDACSPHTAIVHDDRFVRHFDGHGWYWTPLK